MEQFYSNLLIVVSKRTKKIVLAIFVIQGLGAVFALIPLRMIELLNLIVGVFAVVFATVLFQSALHISIVMMRGMPSSVTLSVEKSTACILVVARVIDLARLSFECIKIKSKELMF